MSHFARWGDGAAFIKTFHLVDGLVLIAGFLTTHEGWGEMRDALRIETFLSA